MKQKFCSKRCLGAATRDSSGTCSHDGCDRKVRAKGVCNMHYKAMLRAEGRISTKTPWTDERKDAWHRRRALIAKASTGDPVLISEIAERDDWICQLCFEPVSPGIAWPDAMCKSIDHIVPISHGGTHDPSNAQLAHFKCNAAKGNRVA